MHDGAGLDLREELIQLRQDGGALRPDLDHLVVGERREAPDPEGGDLTGERPGGTVSRQERATVRVDRRRSDAGEPALRVRPFGKGLRAGEDVPARGTASTAR